MQRKNGIETNITTTTRTGKSHNLLSGKGSTGGGGVRGNTVVPIRARKRFFSEKKKFYNTRRELSFGNNHQHGSSSRHTGGAATDIFEGGGDDSSTEDCEEGAGDHLVIFDDLNSAVKSQHYIADNPSSSSFGFGNRFYSASASRGFKTLISILKSKIALYAALLGLIVMFIGMIIVPFFSTKLGSNSSPSSFYWDALFDVYSKTFSKKPLAKKEFDLNSVEPKEGGGGDATKYNELKRLIKSLIYKRIFKNVYNLLIIGEFDILVKDSDWESIEGDS